MSELIYQDEQGNETRRMTKGKGRPPKGAVKQEDGVEKGNFIVKAGSEVSAPRMTPEYITTDESGNEIEPRTLKGRGRPKPNFVKQTDGPNMGHWVKVVKAETIVETPTETVVETTVEEVVNV